MKLPCNQPRGGEIRFYIGRRKEGMEGRIMGSYEGHNESHSFAQHQKIYSGQRQERAEDRWEESMGKGEQ